MIILNNNKSMMVNYKELCELIERMMLSFKESPEGEQELITPIGTVKDITDGFYNCEYVSRFGAATQGWFCRTPFKSGHAENDIENIADFFIVSCYDNIDHYGEKHYVTTPMYILTMKDVDDARVWTEKIYKIEEHKPTHKALELHPLFVDDSRIADNCNFPIRDYVTKKLNNFEKYEDCREKWESVKFDKAELAQYKTDIAQHLCNETYSNAIRWFNKINELLEEECKSYYVVHRLDKFNNDSNTYIVTDKSYEQDIADRKARVKTITARELFEQALAAGNADIPLVTYDDNGNMKNVNLVDTVDTILGKCLLVDTDYAISLE